MKRLIRSAATGEFFKGGGWTKDPKRADDFPTLRAAVEAESTYDLRRVELFLDFEAEAARDTRIRRSTGVGPF
jgi:hypothetical protein